LTDAAGLTAAVITQKDLAAKEKAEKQAITKALTTIAYMISMVWHNRM
jgi:hypothetical protein